jgi:CheY-like chemotaxis protein
MHTSHDMLLVEDNVDDVFLIRRALKLCRIENPLQIVTNGQQALDYLSGTQHYGDRVKHPLPFMIFLDLKLPHVDGCEILSWLRQQPALQFITVVVLTSSTECRDRDRAYSLGARSFLNKPPTPETLQGVFESLKSFWLSKTNSTPLLSGPEDAGQLEA